MKFVSSTPGDYEERLRIFFERFSGLNLKINPEKGDFFRKKFQSLGHTVREHGSQADHSRVKAVGEIPETNGQAELKSFLSHAS